MEKLVLREGVKGVGVRVINNSSEKESLTDAEVVMREADKLSSSENEGVPERVKDGVWVCNPCATNTKSLSIKPSTQTSMLSLSLVVESKSNGMEKLD
jgi:ribosomal protein L37AE/L43A